MTTAPLNRLARARDRAFTLMELLVVISVIGLLAALLFPVLVQVRKRAWQATCVSQLKQLSAAYLLYVADHDEQLLDWFLPGPPRPAPFASRRFWPELLAPYVRSDALYFDPAADWQPQDDLRLADYALMTSGPEGHGTVMDPYRRWPGPPLALSAVVRPAETVYLLDGWTTTGWRLGPVPRHDGVNAAFLDGHVRWLPVHQLSRVATDGRGSYWLLYATADR